MPLYPFWGESSPTKIIRLQKKVGALILTSLLEDLVPVSSALELGVCRTPVLLRGHLRWLQGRAGGVPVEATHRSPKLAGKTSSELLK